MTDAVPTPTLLAAFTGAVTCRRTRAGLIFSGTAADAADEGLIVTLTAAGPAELPGRLSDVSVSALGPRHYRVVCAQCDCTVGAVSAHVHRDIAAAFYGAIPPRAVPLGKRIFWRCVMALARSRSGKRVLLAMRGR